MLAGIQHRNTAATALTVGLRDAVLLEMKVGYLERRERDRVLNTTCAPLGNDFVPRGSALAAPSTESTRFSDTFLGADTEQQAAKQQTRICLQTKPEGLRFRVAACSGFHIHFLKFWGFYKKC